MNVIANTTIISNFASVSRLDILRELLEQLYITTEVYAEIQDGLAEGYDFYAGIESHMYPLASVCESDRTGGGLNRNESYLVLWPFGAYLRRKPA